VSAPAHRDRIFRFLRATAGLDPSAGGRPSRRNRALLLAVLLGGGALVWLGFERMVLQPWMAGRLAQSLQTVVVTRGDLGASTDARGVVTAVRKVNLSPNVASRIDRLYLREGDPVARGQLVAVMESEALQARASGLRAQLEAAKASLSASVVRRKRYEALLASGAVSEEQMEELRNEERQAALKVEEARYQLKETQAELRNTRVYAPFAGIITRQFAQEGQFVTPTTSATKEDGATSTSIAELSSGLEVEGKIPEASLTEITPGQNVEIITDAFPGQVFQGRVKMVSPRAVTENEVNSFPVEVTIVSGQGKLKPAMTVRLRFLENPVRGALVLPLAALTTGSGDTRGVLRLKPDGELEFVPVTPGRISGDRIQIRSGLQKGDRVLISAPPPGVSIPGYEGPK
jgi:HlyD family secretion protein